MFYDKLLPVFKKKEESVLLSSKVFYKYHFHHCILHLLALSIYQCSEAKNKKPKYIFESASEIIKLSSEILIQEMHPVVLEKSEFDCREKPLEIAIFAL